MITEEMILPFGRYKYALPFSGSYKGMRFNIVHPKPGEDEPNLIYVDVWPEPWSKDKTPEALIVKNSFEYSKEGYDQMLAYLNSMYEDRIDEWSSLS